MKLSSLFRKIWGYIRIIRPINTLVSFIAVLVAMLIASGEFDFKWDVYLFIGFATFFVMAQGNTFNDIIDIEVDRINSPERVLPSGILTKKEVQIYIIILTILAIFSATMIDIKLNFTWPFSTFWAIINLLILDIYNLWLKKKGIMGNFMVAYSSGSVFFYADLVINQKISSNVSIIGLFTLFFMMGREILKDIGDFKGDKIKQIDTVAIRYGMKKAAVLSSIFMLLAITSSILFIYNQTLNNQFQIVSIVLILVDISIIIVSIVILRSPKPHTAFNLKKLLKGPMLLAVITVVLSA